MYINHRPAFGLQPERMLEAFESLGVSYDGICSIDRGELLDLLQNKGNRGVGGGVRWGGGDSHVQ